MPEIEAKFLIQDPDQFQEVLERLESLGYSVVQGPTERLVDRYFDTDDWSIMRAGWSYRCREQGGERQLTLKAVGSSKGPVFVRDEIEQSLPNGTNGVTDLPKGPVEERLDQLINGSQCRELFHVENERTVYRVSAPEAEETTFKLALDRAHVFPNGHSETRSGLEFSELELELEKGEVDAVQQVADALCAQEGLVPAQLSKFERGMQAAGLPTLVEQRAGSSYELTPKSPMLHLVYHHLHEQLRVLELQHPRAWEGLNPEGVHQMRVAIRRTRSVLRAFRDLLKGETVDHLNGELRWLASKLGEVRDADVYWETFHQYRMSLPKRAAEPLATYEQHLTNKSNAARTALIAALSSQRYDDLIAELERFVHAGPPSAVLRRFGSVRISDGADLYVRPAVKKMLRRGGAIRPRSSASKLHKLRIEGKRLRYLLEFLGEVEERWSGPIKAARNLQDGLGEHQDAYNACERLKTYAETVSLRKPARQALLSLGRLLHIEEERLVRSRQEFPKTWAKFEKRVSDI